MSCDNAGLRDIAEKKKARDKARIAVHRKQAELNAAQITADGQTSKKSRKTQVDIERMKKDLKVGGSVPMEAVFVLTVHI